MPTELQIPRFSAAELAAMTNRHVMGQDIPVRSVGILAVEYQPGTSMRVGAPYIRFNDHMYGLDRDNSRRDINRNDRYVLLDITICGLLVDIPQPTLTATTSQAAPTQAPPTQAPPTQEAPNAPEVHVSDVPTSLTPFADRNRVLERRGIQPTQSQRHEALVEALRLANRQYHGASGRPINDPVNNGGPQF